MPYFVAAHVTRLISTRQCVGLIPALVKCKLSIKLFNLLNENVVLNCISIPQGITSCSRRAIKQLYKEVQSYQFHANNINVTPRARILTTKALKEYFSATHLTHYTLCSCFTAYFCYTLWVSLQGSTEPG